MDVSSQLPGLALSRTELFAAVLIVFAAAIVRGYSGFGFSMLAVTALSLLRPPAEIVPTVLLLEIAASVHLLPAVWRDVDWASLGWLLLGTFVATPLGVAALAAVPADAMRVVVSMLVLVATLLLWRGFALRKIPGRGPTFVTGMVAGVLNGSAAIAGPPAILFYFSSPAGVAVSRASLITYFLGTDLMAAAVGAAYGLVTVTVVLRAGTLLLPLAAGVALGNRRFVATPPESFRRFVLILLMLLSMLGLLRALHGGLSG